MMPVYRFIDSNPHQRNQAPSPHHYFPGFEAVPPHLEADPYKSSTPVMYEPWHCNSNYGYPVPCHSCCNYGNFPGPGYYSFRPPHPHFAPSPTFHHYPTISEPYPVYYVPPPPHPSNEQPRYEYDKEARANYHCCGCPNHSHHQKNDRRLKIKEQEPDAEQKEVDSVVPVQPRNNSYPIVWIPSEYVNKNRIDQPGRSNLDKQTSFTKPSKSLKLTEQEPRVWNGWLPLDMNNLESMMQGEGERRTQNQQNEDEVRQFPFPIFWWPSDWKQEENENQDKLKMESASDHSKRPPACVDFVPVEPLDNDVRMEKPQANEDIARTNKNVSEMTGKTANKVCIPVKEMQVDRDMSEAPGKRRGDVNMKRIQETTKDELGGTTTKRKSPSPPKSSKLPPVCLKVDPLPKKKNGNGSPKSPSHESKGQNKETKASTASGLKGDVAVNTQNQNGSLDTGEPGKMEIKNIPVLEKRSKTNMAGDTTSANHSQALGDIPVNLEDALMKPITERTAADSCETGEGKIASFEGIKGAEKADETSKATKPDESSHGKGNAETSRMSDAEAAKLIQSTYRGYEVRKWEPLKKLKQIAKVREQMHDIKNGIQALGSSFDPNKDGRQRLLIGEMIMSLLLKLDTIQGLHPIVRDARKSLAKELVTLQEKLDSLTIKQADEKGKELDAAESADYPKADGCIYASIEDSANATEVSISSLDGTNEDGKNIKEPEQEHLRQMVDEQANSKDEEPHTDQNLDGNTENKTSKVACDSELHAEQGIRDGVVSVNLEHASFPSSVQEQKSNADKSLEVNGLSREEKLDVDEMDDLVPMSNNADNDTMRTLPEEKIDQVHAVCERAIQIGKSNAEKEFDLLINPTLSAEVEILKCTNQGQEIDLLEELPVGIIDEEPALSEIEKCEPHEMGESNTLSSTEGPLAYQSDEVLVEVVSKNCEKGQKENEFTKSSELEEELEQMQEEVINEHKFESILKPEEVPLKIGEESYDKVQEEEDDYGTKPVDHTISSESEAGSTATQDKEVEEDQPVGAEGKEELEQKNGVEVEERDMHGKEKTMDIPRVSAEERVLVGTDAPSEPNVEPEFLPASPITGQKVNNERDLAEIGGDNRLVEENKKLREMMEKLMEAGKDQLAVISNLTGRVKDLEKKLSRHKKSGKPRHRRLYSPSYSRPMRTRGKAAEVAM